MVKGRHIHTGFGAGVYMHGEKNFNDIHSTSLPKQPTFSPGEVFGNFTASSHWHKFCRVTHYITYTRNGEHHCIGESKFHVIFNCNAKVALLRKIFLLL